MAKYSKTSLRFSCIQKHDHVSSNIFKNPSTGNFIKATTAQNEFLKFPLKKYAASRQVITCS